MIKQVQVIRTNTLADSTPRVTIDILGGTGKDMGEMTDLIKEEVTMILCRTEDLEAVITEVGNMLVAEAQGKEKPF